MRIALLVLAGVLAAGLAIGNASTAQAAVDHYHVESASTSQTAGEAFVVTVTARDSSDNITAENITVTLSSTTGTVVFDTDSDGLFDDPTAELVDGIVNISARDNTAHDVTINVTDGSVSGISSTYTVNPAPIGYYTVTSASRTQTAGLAFSVTVAAYDTYDNLVTSDNSTSVTMTSSSGTMAFDANGDATYGDNSKMLTNGTFDLYARDTDAASGIVITATDVNLKTGTSSAYTIDPGLEHHIVISPDTATITAGSTQAYTAMAYDEFENSIGDVTALTTFSVQSGAGGSWNNAVYTSENSGAWTVTGQYGELSDAATLNVSAGVPNYIIISPSAATITAGSTQAYTAVAYDQFHNSLGSVTGSTSFSITTAAGGSWAYNVYTSAKSGGWVVTGNYNGLTDTAALTVNPAAADSLALTPAGGSAVAGVSFSIVVTARDTYGNTATGYLGTVHFTSTDSAATLSSDYTFVSGDGGAHIFSVTLLTAGNHSVAVTDTGNAALTDTRTWSVNPSSSVDHIIITSASASIPAGSNQAYAALAYDQFNNPIGDVTLQTAFSVNTEAGGSWAANVYTSEKAGTWTVTGVYAAVWADASLAVTAGEAHHIVISPGSGATTAGSTLTYVAEAFDQWDNSLGFVTDNTSFSIDTGAGGSWAANTYTSRNAGTWTVTGKYGALSHAAILAVNPGPIDHYDVSSSSYSQQPGVVFTVTVVARDAFDNLVDDSSTVVVMSSDSQDVYFDANGDGLFDDSSQALANGTFTIAAKCSGAASAMTIVANSDGTSGTSPAYSVTADPDLTAPSAADDSYHVPPGTVLMGAAPGVLANDTGAGGEPLTAILVRSVNHGTLKLNSDGSFTYTPESDFSGTDSFTYKAAAGAAESNIATVTINVEGVSLAASLSPWAWAGPLMAGGLIGGALLLVRYWRRRGRMVIAPAPAAASRRGSGRQNRSGRGRAAKLDERRELDSVTALKAKMTRLNQDRGNRTERRRK